MKASTIHSSDVNSTAAFTNKGGEQELQGSMGSLYDDASQMHMQPSLEITQHPGPPLPNSSAQAEAGDSQTVRIPDAT
jgi:hypothetical protein